MAQAFSARIHADQAGERLDVWLTHHHSGSRSFWQQAIKAGGITLNQQPTSSHYRLQAGDVVDYFPDPPTTVTVTAHLSVPIIYQDRDVLVVNKPAGIVVHPPAGSQQPSVMTVLADKVDYGVERGGIVHRLDKDTSGVMIVARTNTARRYLISQFKSRQVQKTYLTLVHGHLPQPAARIELPLARARRDYRRITVDPAGKEAVLTYKTKHAYRHYTLVEVNLLTGRTHQIRVQFSYLGHPVAGDVIYGRKQREPGLARQFLHASALALKLPNGQDGQFVAPLSDDLQTFLDQLT